MTCRIGPGADVDEFFGHLNAYALIAEHTIGSVTRRYSWVQVSGDSKKSGCFTFKLSEGVCKIFFVMNMDQPIRLIHDIKGRLNKIVLIKDDETLRLTNFRLLPVEEALYG